MKASLLILATIASVASIAAVDAAPHGSAAPPTDPVNINRCNVNLWPGFSATPCRPPPGVTTYG